MKQFNPLVSIGVITYNSSHFILETLESIKSQTYKNIELVVTDDCSTDDTVDICKQWLMQNRNYFTNVNLIVASCNTGTSANYNRAVNGSQGEWFKGIAGDDLLMPDCIENNLNYIINNPDTNVLFSQMLAFQKKNDGTIEEYPYLQSVKSAASLFTTLSTHDQYLALLEDNPIVCTNAPTLFARRDLLLKYPFNEYYKYSEDVPEWIKLTKLGVHINCMDIITVKYRRGDTITSMSKSFYSSLLMGSKRLYFWNELEGYLREEGLYDTYNRKRKYFLIIELIELFTKNKTSLFNRIVVSLIYRFFHFFNYPKF